MTYAPASVQYTFNNLIYAMKLSLAIAALALLMLVTGCTDDSTSPSKAGTFNGPTVNVGKGTANSWVTLDADGNPTSIGMLVTAAGLDSLPTEETSYTLALPSQASATAYNHISFDWNPHGHEPPGIYDTPHFDVHFYHISSAERDMISPLDSVNGRTAPEADAVPQSYFTPPPGGIVPRMGIHYLDPTSPELSQTNPQPFDKTFIYGFWAGKMIFTEPMITLAYLKSKPNFTQDLKLPVKYPKAGVYYATKVGIKYDSAKNGYIVSLDGLTKR